jgi:phosphoribosylanthranilate isomerase
MKAKLKICGMKVPDNIAEAVALQPDYMGFILYPGSKRFIAALDASVIRDIPATIKTTGVFVDEDLEIVKNAVERYHFKAVQLHGAESPAYCRELKAVAEVIKAFGVDESFDFDTLNAYDNAVDYFLFDTQTAEHGGSGKTFNWQLLENYKLQKPYFLSGGIGAGHAAELLQINDKRLYAVDVNSRFEHSAGLKDIVLLTEFKESLDC